MPWPKLFFVDLVLGNPCRKLTCCSRYLILYFTTSNYTNQLIYYVGTSPCPACAGEGFMPDQYSMSESMHVINITFSVFPDGVSGRYRISTKCRNGSITSLVKKLLSRNLRIQYCKNKFIYWIGRIQSGSGGCTLCDNW